MLKSDLEKEVKRLSEYAKQLEQDNSKLESRNETLEKDNEQLIENLKKYKRESLKKDKEKEKIKDEIQLMCKTHLHVMYPYQVKYNESNGQAIQTTNEDEHFRFINSISEYFEDKPRNNHFF